MQVQVWLQKTMVFQKDNFSDTFTETAFAKTLSGNIMKVNKYTAKTNEEWRYERSKSIGASAVGAIIGVDYFRTPLQVARTMRDELNGIFNFEETLAMKRGHAYEGGVAELFSWKTGKQIIASSGAEYLLRRDDIPFMHASPDRIFWVDEDGAKHGKQSELNKGILECKTTRMPVDADNLPVKWIFQLQVQMGISGYHHGAIAWDVLTSADGFGYRFFDFNEEIFNAAVEACRHFWERCIEGDEDPEPVNASDILLLYPQHTIGKTITVNTDTTTAISELKELKDAKKKLEEAIDQYADRLKAQFTDEEAMVDNTGRVLCTFKTNSRGQRQFLVK